MCSAQPINVVFFEIHKGDIVGIFGLTFFVNKLKIVTKQIDFNKILKILN